MLEQTREAAEQAQAVLDQAQEAAATRQQVAQKAHQRSEQLAAIAQDLADQAAAAITAAGEAGQAADAADRDAVRGGSTRHPIIELAGDGSQRRSCAGGGSHVRQLGRRPSAPWTWSTA